MKDKLEKYMKFGDSNHYTNILNIMLNNRSKDWFSELGKYIDDTIDIGDVPGLSFYLSRKPSESKFKNIKDFGLFTNVDKKYDSDMKKYYSGLSNAKKNDDDSFVMVMMDQIFDGGLNWSDREGSEFNFNLPTEQLMTFDNLLEVSISIVKKFNLVQCDVPRDSEKGVYLQNNLICGTSEYSFDLYEHINIFDIEFESVMKNMKYIFNVEPFKETTWDDKYRLGFKVCCC